MINIKVEIAKLKNNSTEYNKAIDDVLNLYGMIFKSCKIVHTKTGLFFNGYADYHRYKQTKGKNTLSPNNSKGILQFNKTDNEIFEIAFGSNLVKKENEKKYMRNIIVYSGSEIHKILSKHYKEYEYLPLEDFHIERE